MLSAAFSNYVIMQSIIMLNVIMLNVIMLSVLMPKLQLTGPNLGIGFNSRSGLVHAMHVVLL
jgi:hypothetical protein